MVSLSGPDNSRNEGGSNDERSSGQPNRDPLRLPKSIKLTAYLNDYATLQRHQAEAAVALLKYMNERAPDTWREVHGSAQYGMLLDFEGSNIRKKLFLEEHRAELLLAALEEFDEDSESNGSLLDRDDGGQHLLEEHFSGLTTIVLAVGVLPSGRFVHFVVNYRQKEDDLILPIEEEGRLNFKLPSVTSKRELIGLIVTTLEKAVENGVSDDICDYASYVSPNVAECELAQLAYGEISPLLCDMLVALNKWGNEVPDFFEVILANSRDNGSVEALILLGQHIYETDGDTCTEAGINHLGVAQVIYGFAQNGLFKILEFQLFPNDLEYTLYKLGLAEPSKEMLEAENMDNDMPPQKAPPEEYLKKGEVASKVNQTLLAATDSEVIAYKIEALGFKSIDDFEMLSSIPFGIDSVSTAQSFLLETYKKEPRQQASVGAIYYKKTDQIHEYVIAFDISMILVEGDENPQPNFILLKTRSPQEENGTFEIRIIGLQTDPEGLAAQFRMLVAEGERLQSILSSYVLDQLPIEVSERQLDTSGKYAPLQYSIGFTCPPEIDVDIVNIPVNIYDPNSKQIFSIFLCWDNDSGIFPLDPIFSWEGIKVNRVLGKESVTFCAEREDQS